MTKARQIDPSFVLKIASPGAKGSIVPRAWLTRLFDRIRDHRFVVVHAQGGYGKTTLLLEWRRELLRNRAFVGWLTIDERDDAPRFLYGLIACLREATGNPKFGNDALDAAKAAGEEIGAMTAILATIAETARPITILLDDAHLLPEATSRLLLPYLLHNLPANMQVVAGARQPLRIATSELAARGEFVAIGLEDLRLHLDETIECIRGRFGTRFDVDACARIHDTVAGWPMALRLAVSVLDQEPAAGVGAITGSSRDIGLFFAETVLARLSPAEAEFVVATSIVDALHPDLCRAMTGLEEADAILGRLQAASPIFASSEGSEWMRMHPLARGAFAVRFAALPVDRQRDLHWRAAQWLHTHGDVEAAARHAMAADRSEEAYGWIGQYLLTLGRQFARRLVLRLGVHHVARRDALEQLGYQAESAVERNSYLAAAMELRSGGKKIPSPLRTASPDTIRALSVEDIFDLLGVRLNATKAEGQRIVINWNFSDSGKRYMLNLENSALTFSAERNAATADATLTLTRPVLDAILAQQMSLKQAMDDGKIKVAGDPRTLGALFGMLDTFRPDFELIAPNPPAQ